MRRHRRKVPNIQHGRVRIVESSRGIEMFEPPRGLLLLRRHPRNADNTVFTAFPSRQTPCCQGPSAATAGYGG